MLTDEAYFGGCLLVASAHNMPVDSWPWRFASVLSVASHAEPDPELFFYNPRPPVEFYARGVDVVVAWAGGTTIRASGNSFATPHMAGMAARVLGAHPGLRPFEVKTALHLSAEQREEGVMRDPEDLRAAVAAGVLAAARGRAPLLQSIADVARAIFGARASSIMLFDAARAELVFEAVSGEGAELLGRRLPKDTGIAGWVLGAREPIVVEDVAQDPRFAADVARAAGYVPQGIMAAPLLLEERALGVLSILDRPKRASFSLVELDLLGLFAHQAAVALELFEASRRMEAALRGRGELASVARLAAALDGQGAERLQAAAALMAALESLLSPSN